MSEGNVLLKLDSPYRYAEDNITSQLILDGPLNGVQLIPCTGAGHLGWRIDPYDRMVIFITQAGPPRKTIVQIRSLSDWGAQELLGLDEIKGSNLKKTSLRMAQEQYDRILKNSKIDWILHQTHNQRGIEHLNETDLQGKPTAQLFEVKRYEANSNATAQIIRRNLEGYPTNAPRQNTCEGANRSMRAEDGNHDLSDDEDAQYPSEEDFSESPDDGSEAMSGSVNDSGEERFLVGNETNEYGEKSEHETKACAPTEESVQALGKDADPPGVPGNAVNNTQHAPADVTRPTIAKTSALQTASTMQRPIRARSDGQTTGVKCPEPNCEFISYCTTELGVKVVMLRHRELHLNRLDRKVSVCVGAAGCKKIFSRKDSHIRHCNDSKCAGEHESLTAREFLARYPDRSDQLQDHLNKKRKYSRIESPSNDE